MITSVGKVHGKTRLTVKLGARPGGTAQLGRVLSAYIGPTQTLLRAHGVTPIDVESSSSGAIYTFHVDEAGIYSASEIEKGRSTSKSTHFAWDGVGHIRHIDVDDAALLAGVSHGEYVTYAKRYGEQCMWERARVLLGVASRGEAEFRERAHAVRGELSRLRQTRREGMPVVKGKTPELARAWNDLRDRLHYKSERYAHMGEQCAAWLMSHCSEMEQTDHMEDVERCVMLCDAVQRQCRIETRPSVFKAIEPAIEATAQTFLVRVARVFAQDVHPEDIRTTWMYLPFNRRAR